MTDWHQVLGCSPDELCGRTYASRPSWITGYISFDDAKFLFHRIIDSRANVIVEIGTASGLSTAIICRAAHAAALGGRIREDYRVETYDIDPRFYANREFSTGDAAREMLEPALLEHIDFFNPATTRDVARRHRAQGIRFAFIDASHQHPWPTIDLLTLLPVLEIGGEVALHDINLPIVDAGPAGAKYLYDDLEVEKRTDLARDPPNIGSITVPQDKQELRDQLLAILDRHEWETTVADEVVSAAKG